MSNRIVAPHDVVEQRRVKALELRKEGQSIKQIADAMGLTYHTINYYVYGTRRAKVTKDGVRTVKVAPHAEVAKRRARALELKSEGLRLKQIAEKMGLSRTTVNYYLYGGGKSRKALQAAAAVYASRPKAHRIVSVLGATTTSGGVSTNGTAKSGLKEWLEQYLASPNLQEIVHLIEKGEM